MMMSKRGLVAFVCGALVMAATLEAGSRVAVDAVGVPPLLWHEYGAQLKIDQLDRTVAPDDVDVVVVGTSMAQQGLVPDTLAGGATYNASLNGGIPQVMEPWLLDHVLPRTAPTTVVWGLSSLDFSAHYGDATVNAYQSARSTKSGVLSDLDLTLAARSSFFANRSTLRDPSALAGSERTVNRDRYQQASAHLGSDGQRTNYTIALSEERAEEIRSRLSPDALDLDDLAAVIRVIDELRRRGINVVLVEMPVPPRFVALNDRGLENQKIFQQTLEGLSSEAEVPLIRVGESFADEDFVDYTHLSAEGASRFSSLVDAQLGALRR